MSKNLFCLIKTCAQISNSLYQSVKLSTLYSALNLQCQWKMASIKRILRSYPWKNYKNFNWNGSFKCPKKYFAWLKLRLWSRNKFFGWSNWRLSWPWCHHHWRRMFLHTWHLYHKLSITLNCLGQHSVTCTKNFLTCSCPAPSSAQTKLSYVEHSL